MEKVTVSANALYQLLNVLNGPAHHIRELQALRGGPFGVGNPIDTLVAEFNAAASEPPPESLISARTEPDNNLLVAWRYRFRNARGWGDWLIHHGPDRPVNVAFDAIELWPLYARSASTEEKINDQPCGD